MKRFFIILMAFFASPILAQQSALDEEATFTQQLSPFLLHDDITSISDSKNLQKLLVKLNKLKKRKKTDEAFLRSLFYKTHQKLLVSYDRLACMDETLENGKYGCLTGTALYALLLNEYGYDYEIIKLPTHVYLEIQLDNQQIVFESTQPRTGFITDLEDYSNQIEQYRADNRKTLVQRTVGAQEFDQEKDHKETISLSQLVTLEHFNEAVKYYKLEEFELATAQALRAYQLNPNSQNEKMMQLVIGKILDQRSLKGELKKNYLNKYISQVKKKKLSQTK